MKTLNVPCAMLLCLAVSNTMGCASTPKPKDSAATSVFDSPLELVKTAAVDALVVTGFELKKDEATYIEGRRARKVGLFVGSGGETVGVWFASLGPDKTEAKIDTAKSFVGMAGQKNWNKQILAEMEKSLGQ